MRASKIKRKRDAVVNKKKLSSDNFSVLLDSISCCYIGINPRTNRERIIFTLYTPKNKKKIPFSLANQHSIILPPILLLVKPHESKLRRESGGRNHWEIIN